MGASTYDGFTGLGDDPYTCAPVGETMARSQVIVDPTSVTTDSHDGTPDIKTIESTTQEVVSTEVRTEASPNATAAQDLRTLVTETTGDVGVYKVMDGKFTVEVTQAPKLIHTVYGYGDAAAVYEMAAWSPLRSTTPPSTSPPRS